MVNKLMIIAKRFNPIFYKILYMSIISTIIGLIILIIQKIFDKKISPKWKCIIWLVYIFSLLIPFSFKTNINNYITERCSEYI